MVTRTAAVVAVGTAVAGCTFDPTARERVDTVRLATFNVVTVDGETRSATLSDHVGLELSLSRARGASR